jgi:Radical SAM superfamily
MSEKVTYRKSLKAVVAVPPVKDFYFTRHRFSSLGARTVCKVLKANGVESVFLDFPSLKEHGQHIDLPDEIAYLRPFLVPRETGRLSYFTKYQLFGPSIQECAEKIYSHHPTLCFLCCFAFSYGNELIDLSRNIKKLDPAIKVVAGGAGVTAYPHHFLKDPSIDFALCGEAEVNLGIFLDTVVTGAATFDHVPNVLWKKDGIVLKSQARDSSNSTIIEPLVAKVWETRRSVHYSTCLSRGCPNKCRFCSNWIAQGRNFRTVAIEKFINELQSISIDENENRRVFLNFEDDNLLLAPEYLIEVMTQVRKRLPKVFFLAENGVDFRLLTPALADQLVSLGMTSFNFTLCSVNKNILEQQGRRTSLSHFESIVRHIAAKHVPVLSYFVAGLEDDSKLHLVDTLAFLFSLPTTVGISMFYAVPGIYGFKNLKRFDKIAPCICNGSSAFPWNGSLSTEELITSFRLSRYINLLTSVKKSPIETKLLEKVRVEQKLFTFVNNEDGISIVEVPEYDRGMVRLFLQKTKPED